MTSERNKKNVTQNATKQEIGAALKLIELLYEQGGDTQTRLPQYLQ